MSEEVEKRKPGRPPKVEKVEPFDDFMRRIERAHIDRDVVAVQATHPDAKTGVWPGTYAGIRTTKGAPSVLYSDGTQGK